MRPLTCQLTRLPLSTVFSIIALIDPQPPATMLTIIGWIRVVGDSPRRPMLGTRWHDYAGAAYALAGSWATIAWHCSRWPCYTQPGLRVVCAGCTRLCIVIAAAPSRHGPFCKGHTLACRGRWLVYIGSARPVHILSRSVPDHRAKSLCANMPAAQPAAAQTVDHQPACHCRTRRAGTYSPLCATADMSPQQAMNSCGCSRRPLHETLPARLNPVFAIGMQVFTAASIIGIILTIAAIITPVRPAGTMQPCLPLYAPCRR